MKIFFAILLGGLAGLVVLPANAGSYYGGHGYSHGGYSYHNPSGYYYSGSQYYSRSYVQPSSYYSGGYWYQSPGYYSYTPVEYTPPVAKPTVPAFTPGWKEKIVDLAKMKDEYAAYERALSALGYPVPPPGTYGYSATYSKSAYYPPVQGKTTYGYSVNSLKEMYGETNLNTLYQQAARLAAGSQSLAGSATGDFALLVDKAGDNAGRVAEILAKAEAARKALEAASAAPSSRSSTTVTRTATAPAGPPMPLAGDSLPLLPGDTPENVAARRVVCGTCHSGTNLKGGFDIDKWASLTFEARKKAYMRLITDDAKTMMPKDGKPLTPIQLKAFPLE